MELWLAVVLLVLAAAGGIVSSRCLRQHKTARIICMALCILVAVVCIIYIGLTLFFVDAVSHQPPAV